MARYIDEKDVYKLVEPTGTARVHCSQIDELPRADVVPKSEVERLEAELDDFTVAALAECKVCEEKTSKIIVDLQKKLSNAKAEVAREIFEEIEKFSRRFMNDEHYIFGDMVWDIAELKKKYTKGGAE